MITPSRLILSSAAALAAALLLVGCAASSGGSSPTNSGSPTDSGSTTAPGDDNGDDNGDDFEAAWLDDGRMFAIVTWGSSTCIPVTDEVTADGQKVTVTFAEPPADQVCTADFAPRASIGALPEGVDPTQDVEFIVTLGDVTDDVDLDGNSTLTGIPGQPTDYVPSAGWFDDEGIVLLTWGSSGCLPIVESIDEQDAGATVTFATEDRVCTRDMAPRATIIELSDDIDDEAEFTLTLVGDDLDAVVSVLRG